jgi:hypothetical protein
MFSLSSFIAPVFGINVVIPLTDKRPERNEQARQSELMAL